MANHELLVRLGLDGASFSKKLTAINRELKNLDKEYDAVSSSMKDFEKTQDGLATKLVYLNNKMKETQGKYKEVSNEIQNNQKDIDRLENKYETLGQALETKKQKLEGMKQSLTSCAKEVKKYIKNIEEIEKVKKKFTEVSKSVKENEKTLESLSKSKAKLTQQIDKLTQKQDKLASANNKIDTSIKKYSDSITKANEKIQKNNTTLQKLEEKHQKVSKSMGENSEEAQKLSAKIDKLKASNEKAEGSITKYNEKLQKLSQEYQKNEASISKYESKITGLKSSLTTLEQKFNTTEKELQQQQKAYNKCVTDMQKYDSSIDKTTISIQKIEQALQNEKLALQNAGKGYEEHRTKIQQLSKELNTAQQELDKTSKALQNKKSALEKNKGVMADTIRDMNNLKKAIVETEGSIKNFKIDQLSKGFEKASKSMKTFGKGMTNIGRTLTYSVSLPIASFGGIALKTFTEFERNVRKVNATFGGAAGDMEKQFRTLSDNTREFAKTTEWSATEVSEAYGYFAMAGVDITTATESMIPMLSLASIGMVDLGLATDIVTDTMTPFNKHLKEVANSAKYAGKDFNEAEYMVDIFASTITNSNTNVELMGETLKYCASTVASTGGDFDDLAVAIGAMANAGIKGSMAGTSLSTGLNRLIKPTKQAKQVMEKYGISIQKTDDGQLDLMGTMEHLREKLSGVDEVTKASIVTQIFGQTAQKGWLAILNTNQGAWDKLKLAVQNADGATKEMMKEMEKSGDYAFKILRSNIDELLISVGNALAPAMVDIAKHIGNVALKLSEWVKKMQETNPKLLEMVGKLALVAVAFPPIMMGLGLFTQGLSSITGGISGAIKGFSNFTKNLGLMKAGTIASTSKLGLLASSFGVSLPVMAGIAGVAIAGVAAALGENESALGWLIEKWGFFGEYIALILENFSGRVQLTFGNVIILVKTLGKMIMALLKGDFKNIDDIWREGWAEIENNTARAWSNIKGESGKAIKHLQNMSTEGMGNVKKAFTSAMEKLPQVTHDNLEQVSSEFATQMQGIDQRSIEILRGTSDTMAMLFEGITEGMDTEAMEKKFKANLDSMLKAGKTTTEELTADFKKAGATIEKHLADSVTKSGEKANEVLKELANVSKRGTEAVANNVANLLKKMDSDTIASLSGLGENWQQLFEGITDTTDMETKEISQKVNENLKKMADDAGIPLEQFKKELESKLKEAGDRGTKTVQDTNHSIQGEMEVLKGTLMHTTSLVGETTSQTIQKSAEAISASLSNLNSSTIEKLSNTSNEWKSILKGTVDDSGNISADLTKIILKNLQDLNIKTPAEWQKFAAVLRQGLQDTNLEGEKLSEQGAKAIADNYSKTGDKVDPSTGKKITEKVTPEELPSKTENVMNKTASAVSNGGQKIVENAGQVGDSASNKLNTNLGEGVGNVNPTNDLLNLGAVQFQMNNASRMAIDAFVQSWTANSSIITGAVENTFESIGVIATGSLSNVGLVVSDLALKISDINGKVVELGGAFITMSSVSLEPMVSGCQSIITSLSTIQQVTTQVNSSLSALGLISLSALLSSVTSTCSQLITLTSNASSAKASLDMLASVYLGNIVAQLSSLTFGLQQVTSASNNTANALKRLSSTTFNNTINSAIRLKTALDSVKTSASTTESQLKKVGSTSMAKINGDLNQTNSRLKSVTSSGKTTKSALDSIAKISFSKINSQLKDLESKLTSVTRAGDIAKRSLDGVARISMSSLNGSINNINSNLSTTSSRAENAKSKISNINNVSFGGLIDAISRLISKLGNLQNAANNAKGAVANAVASAGALSLTNPNPLPEITPFDAIATKGKIDISKYIVGGSFFTPKNISSKKTKSSKENDEIKNLLKSVNQQNELLLQLLAIERNIDLSVNLDGRIVAKTTAKYMDKELETINKRKKRIGGHF